MPKAGENDQSHAAWRRKVRAYVAVGDRGEEPRFVGRKAMFERVELMIEGAMGRELQAEGRTIAIGGAPGAGKSAFLRELAKRKRAEGMVVVQLSFGGLNPVRLFQEVAREVRQPLRHAETRTTTLQTSANAAVVKGGVSAATAKVSRGDLERLRDSDEVPWEMLKERFGKHLGPDKPLLLLCDEAQNMAPSQALNTFLGSLHARDPDSEAPIPVVPVFAGLADTVRVIGRCGITRPTGGNDLPIGAFGGPESREYALRTLAYLDALASTAETAEWARWFADSCDGWPQHLRSQMTAVAEAMLEADTPKLSALGREAIAFAASAARNDYYGRRLQATGHPRHQALFAALAQAANVPDGAEMNELDKVVYAYAEAKGVTLDAEVMLECAEHAGILQRPSSAKITRRVCPIPSLGRWLEGREHVVPLPPA